MKYIISLLLFIGTQAHSAQYFNNILLNTTNPSGTVTSSILDLAMYPEYSIQIIATGTVACTAEIDASNDYQSNTMILVSGTSAAFTSTGLLYVIRGSYRYIQLKLTGCAGAGSLKAYVIAKEI